MGYIERATAAILSIINGLSRFVTRAAPVAEAVGEAMGDQEVADAARKAGKAAGLATTATDETGDHE